MGRWAPPGQAMNPIQEVSDERLGLDLAGRWRPGPAAAGGRWRITFLCFDAAFCQQRPPTGDYGPRGGYRGPGGDKVFNLEPAPPGCGSGRPDHPRVGRPG